MPWAPLLVLRTSNLYSCRIRLCWSNHRLIGSRKEVFLNLQIFSLMRVFIGTRKAVPTGPPKWRKWVFWQKRPIFDENDFVFGNNFVNIGNRHAKPYIVEKIIFTSAYFGCYCHENLIRNKGNMSNWSFNSKIVEAFLTKIAHFLNI